LLKFSITLLGLLSTSFFLHAQVDLTAKTTIKKSSEQSSASFNLERIHQSFLNLPKEEQEAYQHLKEEANRLYSKQRHFESLALLYQMRDIFIGDPYIDNQLAIITTHLRGFDQAKKYFQDYTTFDRMIAITKVEYDEIIEKTAGNPDQASVIKFNDLPIIRLAMMKKLLSHIALNSKGIDTKKHQEQIKELSTKYDFMDDSPYYYYANAALEYAADNRDAGDNWLATVRRIYSSTPNLLNNWDNTFQEFGFIRSAYGVSYK